MMTTPNTQTIELPREIDVRDLPRLLRRAAMFTRDIERGKWKRTCLTRSREAAELERLADAIDRDLLTGSHSD